jgi:predicted MFS family arabinose efflux permease
MPRNDDPDASLSPAMVGAALAVIISVPLAAWVAGHLDADYDTRAWVYTISVLWALAGAVIVFALTHEAERGRLSLGRVLKWIVSVWLWPLLALRPRRRRPRDED